MLPYHKNESIFLGCDTNHIDEVKLSSCSASTEHSSGHACEKAFDGVLNDGWATSGEGAGAWIKINFVKQYSLATF